MSFFRISLFAALVITSCQKPNDASVATQPSDENLYFKPTDAYLQKLQGYIDNTSVTARDACSWTEIPAGSTDALAAAIKNACVGGVIYLKAGAHTESSSLVVDKTLIFVGETGATLKIKSQFSATVGGITTFKPAFHVYNAPNSAFVNLDIQALDTVGGVSILFENSGQSGVLLSKFTNFQFSVVMERSDRMTILKNTIIATDAWKRGTLQQVMSILNISGTSQYIAQNDISNGTHGMFVSDKWSTVENNYAHNNNFGLVICAYASSSAILPNGNLTGIAKEGIGIKVRNNKITDTANRGILVISGANNNIFDNNEIARSGIYDIELASDTRRLGFLQVATFNNTVNVGSFPNIKIKDCGNNNKINGGGVMVNTATDPCN